MKIKQKISYLSLGVLVVSFASIIASPGTASALTDKECHDKYDGKPLNSKTINQAKKDGCYGKQGSGKPCWGVFSGGGGIKCKLTSYKVSCMDGTNQTARQGMAKPKDQLTEADDEVACKNHGGVEPVDHPGGSAGQGAECATAVLPSSLCADDGSGIMGLLGLIVNILAAGVGIVAVGGLVYAAILYTSAADDAAQTKKAKDTIANVVIGIVAFALMWAFLQFIIPGGVFS